VASEPPIPPPAVRRRLGPGLAAGTVATLGLLVMSTFVGGSPLERLLAGWLGGGALELQVRSLAWLGQLVLGTALGALFALSLRAGRRWAEDPGRIFWAVAFGLLAWAPLQTLAALRSAPSGLSPSAFALSWIPCLAYGVILALVHASADRRWPGPSRRPAPRLLALPGQGGGPRRPWRQNGGSPPARPRLV
jgi:hypothetical protein